MQSVVHLVGIIRPGRGGQPSTEYTGKAQPTWPLRPRRQASRELIYVSALGATLRSQAYPYFYSKRQAELEVTNSGLDYTILRPSVIFGEGDEFLTALAGLVRARPHNAGHRRGKEPYAARRRR